MSLVATLEGFGNSGINMDPPCRCTMPRTGRRVPFCRCGTPPVGPSLTALRKYANRRPARLAKAPAEKRIIELQRMLKIFDARIAAKMRILSPNLRGRLRERVLADLAALKQKRAAIVAKLLEAGAGGAPDELTTGTMQGFAADSTPLISTMTRLQQVRAKQAAIAAGTYGVPPTPAPAPSTAKKFLIPAAIGAAALLLL